MDQDIDAYLARKPVNLRPLKSFAAERRKTLPIFYQVIMEEHDIISAQEFLAKMLVWLRIVRAEEVK